MSDTCTQCGAQIFRDERGAWVDNSGGDVCGVDDLNPNGLHIPSEED